VTKVSASKIRHIDMLNAQGIIPGRLFFMVVKCRPKKNDKTAANTNINRYFFTIDSKMRYDPLRQDFGPLNLACLYRFCMFLNKKLNDVNFKHSQIYYFTAHDSKYIANASVLIGAYQVLYLKRSPPEAFDAIFMIARNAAPFRDQSVGKLL